MAAATSDPVKTEPRECTPHNTRTLSVRAELVVIRRAEHAMPLPSAGSGVVRKTWAATDASSRARTAKIVSRYYLRACR